MFDAIRVPRIRGRFFPIAVLVAVLITTAGASSASAAIQGYGASTAGGTGKTVYRVTNLNDSGPGSFRDAVSQSNRNVVFDVAGNINLQSIVYIAGSFVTVDGFSAPSPGITLRYSGLRIWGPDGSSKNAHDVILRGIRIRQPAVNNAEGDGIDIKYGAYNILIHNVSIDGCGDGNIDITRKAHDITIAWSVLSGCGKNMLIKYEAYRVSLHHNIFVNSGWRNPNLAYTDEFTSNVSPTTTADVRNNLIWHWGDSGGGSILQCGAKINLVNNYYSSPNTSRDRQAKAIVNSGCPNATSASGPLFYTSGNVSADNLSFDLNGMGNVSQPYSATFVDTHSACIGAQDALAGAGAEPLDSVDLNHLGDITLPSCGGTSPAPTPSTPTPAPTPPPAATPPPAPTPTPQPTPAPTPIEQTFQSQVSGGPNDGEEYKTSSVRLTNSVMQIGSSRKVTALRFSDVTIPRGATILSAKVKLYVSGNPTSSVSLRYSGEKVGQSGAFTTEKGSLSARTKTSSAVNDVPAKWTLDSWATSPELNAIVAEIISQSSWSPGNELTIFVANNGSRSYRKIGSVEATASGTRTRRSRFGRTVDGDEDAGSRAATLEVRWLP